MLLSKTKRFYLRRMIQRKIKPCKCGCGQEGYIWAQGMIKEHYYKFLNKTTFVKPSEKTITKKFEAIDKSNTYYRKAISDNILRNGGKCKCDECGDEIRIPNGKNVSHIIGMGSNSTLYHHPLNHFIFGNTLKGECGCEQKFSDEGKRSEMKIYPEFIHRHELLNNEYYNVK